MFNPDSKEVLFQRDVHFDESLPVVHTPTPESTLLTTTSSSFPAYFPDDEDGDLGDPHLPPPQDPLWMTKWARAIVEVARSLNQATVGKL